jgi:hypothetical protein
MTICETILVKLGEIQGDIGEIKGKVAEIPSLVERVRRLENWQWWLKGGWAALATALFLRSMFGQ